MAVHGGMLRVETAGDGKIVDLTDGVRSVVRTSGVVRGAATVFARGATVAVTTMEYEPGGVEDLTELLEQLVPRARAWAHSRLNGDTNAHAHVRAALIGPSESVPIVEGSCCSAPGSRSSCSTSTTGPGSGRLRFKSSPEWASSGEFAPIWAEKARHSGTFDISFTRERIPRRTVYSSRRGAGRAARKTSERSHRGGEASSTLPLRAECAILSRPALRALALSACQTEESPPERHGGL